MMSQCLRRVSESIGCWHASPPSINRTLICRENDIMDDSDIPSSLDAATTSMGGTFRRVGWLGFWIQLVLALVPILGFAMVFGIVRGFSALTAGTGLLGWFSIVSVALLMFTTFWSWRYRSAGVRLAAGEMPLDVAALSRRVWIGIGASSFGILLSLVVVLVRVTYLLLVFLEAPQGGAPVFQTTDGSNFAWITATDMLSLLALMMTASAEIITLLLSLWLLFRLTAHRDRAPTLDTA
jgi:hypothetical protein